MIYQAALFLKKYWSWVNVFHYISVRATLALLTSLIFAIVFGGWFIKKLSLFVQSGIREYTPENHKVKKSTPTMGGIVIWFSVFISTLIFCNLTDIKVWLVLLCMTLFGFIGFIDDYKKITVKKGIEAKTKSLAQLASALCVVLVWVYACSPALTITFPIFKNLVMYIGFLFVIWAAFIIIGASNAVNLTDGLDGLATESLIYNFATFAIITYLSGHVIISNYLHIPYTGASELTVLCCAFVGSLLGFLWYNTYPAQVFMGDVGSLSLGASLALIALMVKQEFLLLISGGLFVVETVSVIMQVISFKYFKKRIFKMAPIHHHFELLGWPESKITVRFAIISFVLCLLSLMTLKLR